MNRYVKGILGGLLAILAAFGWTVAIAYLLWWKPELLGIRIVGIRAGIPLWLTLFLIFSVGVLFGIPRGLQIEKFKLRHYPAAGKGRPRPLGLPVGCPSPRTLWKKAIPPSNSPATPKRARNASHFAKADLHLPSYTPPKRPYTRR